MIVKLPKSYNTISVPDQEFDSLLEIAFGRWISQGWVQLLMLSSLLCLTIALPIWEEQAPNSQSLDQNTKALKVLTQN